MLLGWEFLKDLNTLIIIIIIKPNHWSEGLVWTTSLLLTLPYATTLAGESLLSVKSCVYPP